jgi:hypothetical protein
VNTKLTFSPYLNIIKGISNSSDIGKSVVVKALRLLIENRASKRIRTTNATEVSKVIASDGVTTIGRVKDDKVNGYFIQQEGKEEINFKAIKTDIPFEVQRALNLSEVNIQRQKDTFFLIDESSGQVAKELNKVSGLSSIDAALKLVNSAVTSLTSDVRSKNSLIEQSKIKIEETKWVLDADSHLFSIENLNEEIDAIEEKQKNVTSLVNSFVFYKDKIANLLPESIIEDYQLISEIMDEIADEGEEIRYCTNLVNNLRQLKDKYDAIEIIDLSELNEIQESIDSITTNESSLQRLIDNYNVLARDYSVVSEKYDETMKEISKIEVCPSCGRPMENCDED